MPIFKNPNFDFLKWRWTAVGLSALIILVGAGAVVNQGGLAFGIDFSGGTIVIVQFDSRVTEDAVREAIAGAVGESVVQQYGGPEANEIMIRLPQSGPEQGTSLEAGANAVVAALEQSTLGGFTVVGQELVGPVIGQELQRRGVYAFLSAMVGILVYVGFRFRFSFAVGAIIAVAHDILVTLAMLTFFGFDLSLNVVAAMLTITGYSVNDSIVVFDRVRENMRSMRRDAFGTLVNASINQTLSRTIITSGTTAFAVLALFVFGGEVLSGFAFTMLVGVLSGTYSTIFIAAAVAIVISERRTARRAQELAPAISKRKRRSRKSRVRV
ncbi:MAG: protein translocase subunit SecF [Acidobacteria bacterium]|nr:protein translocase subunit SecF [Acidobacteriota bacterium]|tara:strand:- start:183 stop:1160 length:978 start_codon:yes stop_codon:yes gene_type:complete